MPEEAAIIFMSLFVVCCLFALGMFVYTRVHARRALSSNPYREGHFKYGTHFMVKDEVQVGTIGGFVASCELTVFLTRTNNDQFNKALMLEEQNRRTAVTAYWTVRRKLFYRTGSWCLHYWWRPDGSPGVSMYRLRTNGGTTSLIFDPNAIEFVKDANAFPGVHSDGEKELYSGCALSLSMLRPFVDYRLVEECHAMITQEEHRFSESDVNYLRAKEVAVIRALKFRLDLAQETAEHTEKHLKIKSSVVGCSVRLQWSIDDFITKDGDRLMGFRKDGGYYTADPWDDTGKNGTPIVDSAVSDACVDHPVPGTTHYYTFFVKHRKADGETSRYSLLRFSLHVPAGSDVAKLQTLLQQSEEGRKAAEKRHEQRSAKLNRIEYAIGEKTALMQYRKQKIAEVMANPELTKEEKEELVAAIQDEIADAESRP